MSDPIQEIARQLHIQTLGDGLLAKIRQTIDLLQEAAVERDALRAEAAALRAENARLQNALLEVTARRFAESWKKRTSDADLEQYLSAGIAQLEAERDALAAELAAIRKEQAITCRVIDRIGQLCTTPHESKERFIRRVQSVIEWETKAISASTPPSPN